MRSQPGYDLRRGAAAYAPIVGTLGALAVPAIIVLFTVSKSVAVHHVAYLTLSAGLLIVAVIASLVAAIGLGAIGAEREPTANIPPAIMFIAVPAVISIVSILGAFEVLSAIYLHESRALFTQITGVGGLVGVFFMAFAVGDSWQAGPTDILVRALWLKTQWVAIRSHEQAYKWTKILGITGCIPIIIEMAIRGLNGPHITPTRVDANWLVGAGLIISIVATFFANTRTAHPQKGSETGLRWQEAFGTTLTLSLYIVILLIFLP